MIVCYVMHFMGRYEILFEENKVIHWWTRQYLQMSNSRKVCQIFTKSASIETNSSTILSRRRRTKLWFIPTSRKWGTRYNSRSHVHYVNRHATPRDKSDAMTKFMCNEIDGKTNDRWLNRWISGRDFLRDRGPHRVHIADDTHLLIVLQTKFRDTPRE